MMKAPKKLSDVNVAPIVELSDAQAASITGGVAIFGTTITVFNIK